MVGGGGGGGDVDSSGLKGLLDFVLYCLIKKAGEAVMVGLVMEFCALSNSFLVSFGNSLQWNYIIQSN